MEPTPVGEHDARAGEDWRALNRAAWNERVPLHVASDFYDIEAFLGGRSSLRPFEIDEVGPVAGRSLVHLQCHFGQDTLSWARLGAQVTGLDFSRPGIEAARALAAEAALAGEFVEADVYDAVTALGGRQFDIVYTGFGALVWLPDIVRWAEVVAALVKPGGVLYLSEMHPFTDTFADEELTSAHDYFTRPAGSRYDEPGTYADWDASTAANVTYEWTHPLGAVVSAVIAAGLRLEFLHEFEFTLFQRWPMLERHEDGTYWLPEGSPRLPLIYSLRATKPIESCVST